MNPTPWWILFAAAACTDSEPNRHERRAPTTPTTPTTPTEPTETTPPVTTMGVEVVEIGAGIHEKGLLISVADLAKITLNCTLSDDDAEVHAFAGAAGLEWSLDLRGLLADAEYACVGRALIDDFEAATVAFDLQTGPNPEGTPDLEVLWAPGYDSSAYTLFNTWEDGGLWPDKRIYVVDPEGRIRWEFFLDHGSGVGIDASLMADGAHFLIGGGPVYESTIVDLGGAITFKSPPPVNGSTFHHHAEELADGGLLTLSQTVEEGHIGFGIEVIDPTSGDPIWTWTSQTGFDRGQLIPNGLNDPYHANSVSFVDDADGNSAWVSLAHADQIIRIDRDSGDITHTLGRGGDFQLVDAAGLPLSDEAWFSGQHAPKFRLPLVLLHDNGVRVDRSRALELELDFVAMTAKVVWEWTSPGWYEPIFGDIDRLPNGNILISRGACWLGCETFGLDDERVTDYVEVDPITDAVVWTMTTAPRFGAYRAERIDGCDLFANTRYCP